MNSNTDGRLVLVVVGALVLLPALFMGLGMLGFGPTMGRWGHMGSDGGLAWWMVFGSVVVQLLLLATVAGAGYLFYRELSGTDSETALEELRVAYARGELTDEEYEERREVLEREV